MSLVVPAGVSQGGSRFSEDVEQPSIEEAELSRARGLRRQTSLFRRGQVAAFTPEARLGSVLSTWQPNAVPTLQVCGKVTLSCCAGLLLLLMAEPGNSLGGSEHCHMLLCWLGSKKHSIIALPGRSCCSMAKLWLPAWGS